MLTAARPTRQVTASQPVCAWVARGAGGGFAGSGGVDCDYPEDVLYKAAWSGLQAAAPDAYALLKNMQYKNDDQIAMIAATELDGKEAAVAAKEWVDAHKDVWQAWLPAKP